ncbi:hypothetical protein UFOVP1071_174 [uncultured Caudovirales phage]|uniref:Uncharacterized protein n=1 Tax=uncultured Caudovirales phage TaxID=2100421 RepID=A0A6J5QL56_9CAUD|nr:hypothetical protein UFOVP1071_174 [uncultured Caudovirales phage]
MAAIIKPIGTESVCNTSTFSSYGNSALVKISHASAVTTLALITCKDSSNTTTKWTMSIIGGESLIIEKSATDILTSNNTATTLVATPVAYKN